MIQDRQISWARQLGGPGFTDPPDMTNATLVLDAGPYALVCYMGDGNSPWGHLKKGMLKSLQVLASDTADVGEPAADTTVVIRDDGYEFSPALSAGHHVMRVENRASDERQFRIQRLLPGRTVEEALGWQRARGVTGFLIQGATTPEPPFETRGRLTSFAPAQHLVTTVDLPSGTYLISSLPSRASSKVFEVR